MPIRSPADWHRRYLQQAGWTRATRQYLFKHVNFSGARRILDVGCGTGALFPDLLASSPAQLVGLDIDLHTLIFARSNSTVPLTCGDAARLPYPDASFDIVLCHFLLLWLPDPTLALTEMARVARPGGAVCVLSEPDYGGRIDYPAEFEVLGEMQAQSLRDQGADPRIGRKLRAILSASGLQNIEVLLIGGHWAEPPPKESLEIEWDVLSEDLHGRLAPDALAELQRRDAEAWREGERVLYVPTFSAWGFKQSR